MNRKTSVILCTYVHLKRRLCLVVKIWFLDVQSLLVCESYMMYWDILEDKITCEVYV